VEGKNIDTYRVEEVEEQLRQSEVAWQKKTVVRYDDAYDAAVAVEVDHNKAYHLGCVAHAPSSPSFVLVDC
jgi:predicted transcriptional regulator